MLAIRLPADIENRLDQLAVIFHRLIPGNRLRRRLDFGRSATGSKSRKGKNGQQAQQGICHGKDSAFGETACT